MPTAKKTSRAVPKKIVAKKTLNAAAKTKAKQVKSQSSAAVSSARKVYLASLGAATKIQTRVQNEATKMVDRLTTEAQRITEMTSAAAGTFAKKANAYVREGTMTHDSLKGEWTDAGTFESLQYANQVAFGKS